MSNEERTTEPAGSGDDLQLLEGVGPKYARALRDIGVHTFGDLAHYESPSDLQQALAEGADVHVDLWKIENARGTEGTWIEQARARAEAVTNMAPAPENEKEAAPPTVPDIAEPEDGWRMVQEFTLFLDDRLGREGDKQWQLRVYDGVSGDEEAFSVRDYSHWVEWILDHAEVPDSEKLEPREKQMVPMRAAPLESEGTPTVDEVVADEVQLDIINVEIERSAEKARNELQAGVTFRVSSAEAGRLVGRRIPFQVEVHALNLEDGTSLLAGYTRAQLEPGRLEYEAELTFPMLPLGRYELQSIVLLFPPGKVVSFYEGRTFKIVP